MVLTGFCQPVKTSPVLTTATLVIRQQFSLFFHLEYVYEGIYSTHPRVVMVTMVYQNAAGME